MLIQINTYILVMLLDSFCVQNLHYLRVARVKMSLFLELVWNHQCILIIKKNFFLIFGKGPTQVLDDTTLTVEAQYSINFSKSNERFCLTLHYNGSNSLLFVNATKMHQLKPKYSEIKKYSLCLGKIFQLRTWKETRTEWLCVQFFADNRASDNSNVINIHKYFMKKDMM